MSKIFRWDAIFQVLNLEERGKGSVLTAAFQLTRREVAQQARQSIVVLVVLIYSPDHQTTKTPAGKEFLLVKKRLLIIVGNPD